MTHWGMFVFGMVCGWILISVFGIPVLAWLLASLHQDEILRLSVDNCALRAKIREMEL